MQDPSISSWHLDKRVPIALILGMFMQVSVLVWGAAVMFKDIENNRNGIKALDGRVIGTTTGTFPAGASKFGLVFVKVYSSTDFIQTYETILEDGIYYRRYTSGAWTAWRQVTLV